MKGKKSDPIPEEVEMILETYGMTVADSCWWSQTAQKWIIRHNACEQIASLADIKWPEPPQILAIDLGSGGKSGKVAILGWAEMTKGKKKRREWSTGEASPGNNHNAYPLAMAEKRLKDRLILKLVFAGVHGDLYSEVEADFDGKHEKKSSLPIKANGEISKPKVTMGATKAKKTSPEQKRIMATLRSMAEFDPDTVLADTEWTWKKLFEEARDATRGGVEMPPKDVTFFGDWIAWGQTV